MLENENKIEDIKKRLYDRGGVESRRNKEGIIHTVKHDVDNNWKNEDINNSIENMKKPKSSIFKKLFIVSILFFVGAIGFAVYMFYNVDSSVSSDNIDITVIGNAFTKGGEELPLQIEIVNRNKASLELSNLQISYPSGASDDISDYVRLPRISIGTIKPGETVVKNIKVVLYGEERSNRIVKIDLDYHPEGSNAIFTKEKEYSVNISLAPLSLTISAPDTITSDQPISFNVKSTLNTTLPSGDSIMQLTYPNNFIYESSIPEPTFGNSIWSLSEISQINPISIVINGRIIGEDKDQQVFHVYAGTTKKNDKSNMDIVYNSLIHTVTLVKPFLEANIIAADAVSPGEVIRVKILWKNNLSNRITDGEIVVNVGGNVLDRNSISPTDGFFDSTNNRIIWDRNSNKELSNIEPGDKGEVNFSVKSISLIGSGNTIKEPQLTFDVSIRGRQPSLGSTYTEINNFSKKIVKILSDFQIASYASYGSGAFPPKAESETKYNVTWTLSNSTNGISNAVAKSSIPVYVKWVGSNSPKENISYNEITREIIWNIGVVRANTGGSYNREVNFTLALTPSLSQIGSVPQLMKELSIIGTDVFTGTEVNSKRGSINTLLSSDPNFQPGFERVVK